jgi:hypothetical protein
MQEENTMSRSFRPFEAAIVGLVLGTVFAIIIQVS